MGDFDSDHIRNLALLGHAGSGKSVLAEALLARTGAIPDRSGSSRKHSVSDFTEQEKQVGHSLEAV